MPFGYNGKILHVDLTRPAQVRGLLLVVVHRLALGVLQRVDRDVREFLDLAQIVGLGHEQFAERARVDEAHDVRSRRDPAEAGEVSVDAPVFLDRDATIDKACELIEQAGRAGADLIVFPETWIPGYPFWTTSPRVFSGDVVAQLWKNAVEIGSPAADRLAEAACAANAYVVIGVNERSRRSGQFGLFHWQFV